MLPALKLIRELWDALNRGELPNSFYVFDPSKKLESGFAVDQDCESESVVKTDNGGVDDITIGVRKTKSHDPRSLSNVQVLLLIRTRLLALSAAGMQRIQSTLTTRDVGSLGSIGDVKHPTDPTQNQVCEVL